MHLRGSSRKSERLSIAFTCMPIKGTLTMAGGGEGNGVGVAGRVRLRGAREAADTATEGNVELEGAEAGEGCRGTRIHLMMARCGSLLLEVGLMSSPRVRLGWTWARRLVKGLAEEGGNAAGFASK